MWEITFIPHISLTYPSHQPSLFIWNRVAKWEIKERWGEGLSEGWFFKNPLFMLVSRDYVRDERFFENLFKNSKSGVLFEPCLWVVRIMSSRCLTDANEVFDRVLRGYSPWWNSSFPTWERFIPNVGTARSQAGNMHNRKRLASQRTFSLIT